MHSTGKLNVLVILGLDPLVWPV
eukprot:SAG31_NODE_45009_length_260_cov_0.962733_2_plen_22_part_01